MANHSRKHFSLCPPQDPATTGSGTYLSWFKARAVKVETTAPRPPVIVHQGFWIRSPMKMMSPLRGLLTNITWAAPLRTQSVNWMLRGLSERQRQSHQQGPACASLLDHWLARQPRQTGMHGARTLPLLRPGTQPKSLSGEAISPQWVLVFAIQTEAPC